MTSARDAAGAPRSVPAETALRRAAEHVVQANRLERKGALRDAARPLRDAARALFAASAKAPLAGLCRRLLTFESVDAEVDRELGHLAAALQLLQESHRLLARVDCDGTVAESVGETSDGTAAESVGEKSDATAETSWTARARACGDPSLARAHLVVEGERLRRTGRSEEAVRCLTAAVRLGAGAEAHREWAFALLDMGDLAGALGHVERWAKARPDDPTALLWRAQLLWRNGRGKEADEVWELLGTRLSPGGCAAADALAGEEVALAWGLAGPPLWWARREEIRQGEEGTERPEPSGPLLVLDRDDHFFRLPLSGVLREAGFEVVDASREDELAGFVQRLGRLPAAFVLHFEEPARQGLDTLRALRSHPELATVAVVAVTTLGRRGLDVGQLRELGVVGIIDKRMIPEDVVDRLYRVLGRTSHGRRFVRAPAFFPIDLESGGVTTTEYARNLSVGGIGILSSRRIPANTDVRLRFRLEHPELDVEVTGRVIYGRGKRGAAEHELGVFFYPMEASMRQAIEVEVDRRLGGETPRAQAAAEASEEEPGRP